MGILSFLSEILFEDEPVENFTVTIDGCPHSMVTATDFEMKGIADRYAAFSDEVVVRDHEGTLRYLYRDTKK